MPGTVPAVGRAIQVAEGVVVPESAVSVRAVRSSGPGGQNVNKVASKVELRVDLDRIQGLDARARERMQTLAAPRLAAGGRLLVTSQRTRDQSANLEDARDKVRALVARALVVPRERRPTRASAGARERRLLAKKHRARVKRLRQGQGSDD